jgi:hypothetical protein
VNVQRRFVAIPVADVVGYSKLIGSEEADTLARLRTVRTDMIEPAIVSDALGGRIEKDQQAWKTYQQVEPTASISKVLSRMGMGLRENLDKYAQALRLVGGPE